MINKLCAMCGVYFSGQLNGSYICPECRERELPVQRALVSLESVGQPVTVQPQYPVRAA